MLKRILIIVIALISCELSAEYRISPPGYPEWEQLKTDHFSIFFPTGSQEVALLAAKIAEDSYVFTSDILKHKMQSVVPVVLYPSDLDFQRTNIFSGRIPEEVGGFTEFYKGRIAVPYTADIPEFRHVLAHEIVHAFQYDIIKSMDKSIFSFAYMPLWFIEGMAEYLSIGFDSTADMFMRDAVYNNLFMDLKTLNKNEYYTGYQAYKQGQSFHYYVSEVYGKSMISKIFTDTLVRRNFKNALETNLDKDIFEINKEWYRFYSKKYSPLIKDMQFDDESGKQLKNHVTTGEFYNFHPSISPDGKKIAYITTAEYAYRLVIADYRNGKLENQEDIDGGWYDTSTQYLNVSSNRISWSGDGEKIIYSAQSGDRKIIRIYDIVEKKRTDIKMPFLDIRYPSVDVNFTRIVFIAQKNASSDLYYYDIRENELHTVTTDLFTEKSPVFSGDGNSIYFASNRNLQNDFFSEKYNVFSYDIISGKTAQLVKTDADISGLSVSDDGKKILFSSDKTGINNIYSFDPVNSDMKKHSTVLNGLFSPVMKNGKIYCSAYSYLGYDIMELDSEKEFTMDDKLVSIRYSHEPAVSENHHNDVFLSGDDGIYRDNLFFLLGGTVGYGIAGIAIGQFSDLYGDNVFRFSGEYLYFDEFEKELNFNARYMYLKKRPDFYAGAFRQKNPFAFYSVDSFNDFFNNAFNDTVSLYQYGIYGGCIYPFSRFTALDIGITSYRYERDFEDDSPNTDIEANLNEMSAEISLSNLIYALFGPVDGYRTALKFSETVDFYSNRYNFQNVDLYADIYYNLDNIFVFSFNFSGGILLNGRDDVLYSIGGYNSLRGYGYSEFTGTRYFVFTAETEFVLLERIELGLNSGIDINKIGFALFADTGSAWSGEYSLKNGDRFDDLKIDCGYGFRMHISPELYLKLDFAYPWDGENMGSRKIQFSISMN